MTTSVVRTPCDEGVVRSAPDTIPCQRTIGRWVLAAAVLGSSLTFIDGTVVNVVLPRLQQELGASVAEAQWIVESYALMLAALILVGGSLGDRLGRKRVFAAGVALFGAASIACGLAMDVTQLIVARAVKGIGAALLVPGSLALISANFPKSTRGRAIGTWSGFSAIAAGIGPVLGGWLIEHVSWRWTFLINVPLALLVLLIVWRWVPESRDEDAGGALDWLGAGLATIGLGGIVYALIESNTLGWTALPVLIAAGVGIVALGSFLLVEAHHESPMMPLDLFQSRTFAGANLLTLFLYAALGALFFFLPFNLMRVQGWPATVAGAALLPFVFTMFLLSRWAGGLVERYGSKTPLVIGPLLAAAGFAMFALPGEHVGSYWTSFFPATMVLSLGMTVSVAPLTTTVMGAVDERHAGIASGINNAVSRTAALLAIAAFGVVMVQAFESSLATRLERLPLEPSVRGELMAGAKDLVSMPIPSGLGEATTGAVREAIRGSFIAGFRWVSMLAALLAVASALSSWLLIEGKAGPRAQRASHR